MRVGGFQAQHSSNDANDGPTNSDIDKYELRFRRRCDAYCSRSIERVVAICLISLRHGSHLKVSSSQLATDAGATETSRTVRWQSGQRTFQYPGLMAACDVREWFQPRILS